MAISTQTLNRLFSFGYMAKGVVYFFIGLLALATAFGFTRGVEGPKGVIQWINNQPAGNFLVGLLAVGLLSYCCWRIYRGIADPTNEGSDNKAMIKRLGFIVSGILYGTLSVLAFRLAFDMGGSSGGSSKEGIIARLLAQPWGDWAVGFIGLIVLGVAIYQFVKAKRANFVGAIHWASIGSDKIRKAGRLGFVARGVVFGIVAYFLAIAAIQSDASEFRGTEGAIEYLQQHSYGIYLLGLVGLGLLFYGTYAFMKGKYGKIAA